MPKNTKRIEDIKQTLYPKKYLCVIKMKIKIKLGPLQ